MQMEENAGLGLGVTFLTLASVSGCGIHSRGKIFRRAFATMADLRALGSNRFVSGVHDAVQTFQPLQAFDPVLFACCCRAARGEPATNALSSNAGGA